MFVGSEGKISEYPASGEISDHPAHDDKSDYSAPDQIFYHQSYFLFHNASIRKFAIFWFVEEFIFYFGFDADLDSFLVDLYCVNIFSMSFS